MSELVRLARRLERQLVRYRKLHRQLEELQAEIRSTRKLMKDLERSSWPPPTTSEGEDVP
jgi:hypothetical protein